MLKKVVNNMRNIKLIIKKEMDKIFKFPRIIFSTILLPGLLIFGIYAFMGISIKGEISKTIDYKSSIYLINSPQTFDDYLESYKDKFNFFEANSTLDDLLVQVKEGTIDAVVVFTANFEANYFNDAKITIYSNHGLTNSSNADAMMTDIISAYKQKELQNQGVNTNIFTVTKNNTITDEKKNTGQILSLLLPMFIMTFIFAGALSIGADAIAGEKERGTLATLLMAPIKRDEIIVGKIVSTAIISILSAISSFIGIMASLPFSKELFSLGSNFHFTFGEVAQLALQILLLLLLLGLLASALILIASTYGKSTKEATTYAMPLYMIAILASTISMFSMDLPDNIIVYFIPVYNINIAFKGIFMFELGTIQYLYVVFANVFYIVLTIFLLMKMFKSEKILFNK